MTTDMDIRPSCIDLANVRTSHVALAPPLPFAGVKPTSVFNTFWRFAVERQVVFFARLSGRPAPWTDDPILRVHKFTNAYRASDRVSQYLIRNVIYADDQSPNEVFFRTILFKLFNRIETWELLVSAFGSVNWREYSFQHYASVLGSAMDRCQRIYSAAYIMPSGGPHSEYRRKHEMHLRLLERMMRDGLPARILDAKGMSDAFLLIRKYPTIGDFLAYQYVTDLNYGPMLNYSEMEFVSPGPGARDGIRKCFPDTGRYNDADIIRLVTERQDEEFKRLGLSFPNLWGRKLQLIDCQNLFCEVGKYARIAHPDVTGISGRVRIKQKFHPKTDTIQPWYPPKWQLNSSLSRETASGKSF
ncbi:MAG: nucleotide kinase domain-containing protein [Kiritimatiellia bacterium]